MTSSRAQNASQCNVLVPNDSTLHISAEQLWYRQIPRQTFCVGLGTRLIPNKQSLNPLPTIGNSLKKHKSLYKVLTPSINPPYRSAKVYWFVRALQLVFEYFIAVFRSRITSFRHTYQTPCVACLQSVW